MVRARIVGMAVGLLGAAGLVLAQERTPPKGETVKACGIWGFPTTVLIDPEGRLQSGGLRELATAFATPGSAIPGGGAEGGPESR